MLIIQEIVSRWTKLSRGAPEAVKRNSVPESLVIPRLNATIENDSWIYQKEIFDEYKSFEDPFKQADVLKPFKMNRFGIAEISSLDNKVLITINYASWDGAPIRDYKEKKAFTLSMNESGQLRYNWRISYDEGGWAYQKSVLNIGLASNLDSKLFIVNKPKYIYEDMPSLW
jgi:hypothetical protein